MPVGKALPDWTPPPEPPRRSLEGRYCRVEPLDIDLHAEETFDAFSEDESGRLWTYLPDGPFASFEDYRAWLSDPNLEKQWLGHAIISRETGKACGFARYRRGDAANGVIEIGSVVFSPSLKRSRVATEAIFLLMKNVFDLAYRRCEWKCDSLNAASRRAAQRLGFSYEGVFRQAIVRKGRNRDTAWFACIDSEWPELRAAFERWLAAENFDTDGRQRLRLSDLTRPLLFRRDEAQP